MRLLTCAALATLLTAPALAQSPSPPRPGEELLDRVVAVVGDTILLLSDVNTELQQMLASGTPVPSDPQAMEALAQEIVQARVNDLILLQAARNTGITILDDEVQASVDQQIAEVRERFPSEAAFHAALQGSGLTIERYRSMLAQQFRSSSMVQEYVRMQLARVPRPHVGENELREVFSAQQHLIPPQPPTVSLRQVVIETKASDEARAAARARAEDVLRQAREGADFLVLARRFSDDPGSREHGGQLGWFRRGRMVKPFEDAVFSMRAGQISNLVETDFGFHIIKLEKTRGAERQARHILIRPETTDADVERARVRADSVAEAIRAGGSVRELARRYETPAEAMEIDRIPLDRLPPDYQPVLSGAAVGSVVGPIAMQAGTGTSFAVVRLADRHEGGVPAFDDVRDILLSRVQEQKMLEEVVSRARDRMHVRILL
jgi:peptidyl-prolyl cis-trans isomerase SurA